MVLLVQSSDKNKVLLSWRKKKNKAVQTLLKMWVCTLFRVCEAPKPASTLIYQLAAWVIVDVLLFPCEQLQFCVHLSHSYTNSTHKSSRQQKQPAHFKPQWQKRTQGQTRQLSLSKSTPGQVGTLKAGCGELEKDLEDKVSMGAHCAISSCHLDESSHEN